MRRRDFIGCVSALSLLPVALSRTASAGVATRLSHCGLSQHANATDLVFDLSGTNNGYRYFTLDNPPRLIVDLPGIAPPLPQTPDLNSTPIQRIRSGIKDGGLRMVLDLHHPVQASATLATPQRLVVTLDSAVAAKASGDKLSSAAPAVIAIDPGHGGKDPGAVSHTGTHEKRVAFEIGQRLKTLLQQDPLFQPRLLRTGDYFIPLHQRVLAARDAGAHMFISVHADAAPTTSAKGASVYILSEHGSSSAMARWMAESENSADRYASLRESTLYRDDPRLSSMLLEMSMQGTIEASQRLGKLMLGELGRATALHQRSVNQAGFAVLKSPEIPSILVENGFMSNRDDCQRLVTSSHQQMLAEALYSSVKDYFQRYPRPTV